jgi:hypothetical protein
MQPTLAGFLAFIRAYMNIQGDVLPDDAPVIADSLAVALEIVNRAIACASSLMYTKAVYNLAGSTLLQWAVDNPELPAPKNTFFQDLRTLYNINAFTPGVVQAAADVTTSASILVIEAAKNFTLGNLQNLKDPYGRAYLAIAQDYGPAVWGLTP